MSETTVPPWGKHPELVVHSREPFNGGPPAARQGESFLTPNDLFFVRNHAAVPDIDPAAHRLVVRGLVATPLELSLTDLEERFERVEVTATVQCAGQRRRELIAARPIPGELPWGAEAVSTARWGGWRLADVVRAAGVGPGAAHVELVGRDRVERRGRRFGFGGSLPLAKALAPEVLLADTMNGAPLPPTHGAPLRAVVPGYIGARSVKWLGEVVLREDSSDNYFQAYAYRLYPPAMTLESADAAAGFELGEVAVNSRITAPLEGAEVAAGRVAVRGIAFAGGGRPVRRVDLSADGGRTWTTARLHGGEPGEPGDGGWAWRLFSGEVELAPGERQVVARAWDAAGQTQPEDAAALWNFKGYVNNAWSRVRVTAR